MTQQQPAGAVESAAPAPIPAAPPSTDPVVVAELERLRNQNQYLGQTVQQLGQWAQSQAAAQQEQARQREEARIASLPPQDQGAELAKLARAENAQLRQYIAQQQQMAAQAQQRQAAPQVQDRNSVQLTPEQIQAKKQALVDQVNQSLGLSGERAITVADIPAKYHVDQEMFLTRVEEEGDKRRTTPAAEDDVAKKQAGSRPAAAAANRPLSPSTTPTPHVVERGDFDRVLGNAHRSLTDKMVTPGQRSAQLRQLREEAAAKLR